MVIVCSLASGSYFGKFVEKFLPFLRRLSCTFHFLVNVSLALEVRLLQGLSPTPSVGESNSHLCF